MMKPVRILPHVTIILSVCFIVFLILDIFNPLMNFVGNDISRCMLYILCFASFFSGVACVHYERKCARYQAQDASKFSDSRRRERRNSDYGNIPDVGHLSPQTDDRTPEQYYQGGYRPTGAEYGLQNNISRTVYREVGPLPRQNTQQRDREDDL